MRIAILIITVVAHAPWSQAGLIYLSQNRSIQAMASVQPPGSVNQTQSAVAPDFGPFSDQVSASGTFQGALLGIAQAGIDSTLGASAMIASGNSGAGGRSAASGSGSGTSTTNILFTVDASASYLLSGMLHTFGRMDPPVGGAPITNADVPISLSGPGVNFSADCTIPISIVKQDYFVPVQEVVQLVAGQEYRLIVSAGASQFATATSTSGAPATIDPVADYSITLAPVPEPNSVCLLATAVVFLAVPLRRLQQAGWKRAQH
jgi:hypothetical protein